MAESTEQNAGYISISPRTKRSRVWPDPEKICDLDWKIRHAPDTLTRGEMLVVASTLSAYIHIFSMSQRQFLPTHAAIREHLKRTS